MKVNSRFLVVVVTALMATHLSAGSASAQTKPAFAGIFGARELEIEVPAAPGTNYEMFLHDIDDPAVYDELEYDAARGAGFVVLDPDDESDNRFGPFDNSPNGRDEFDPDDDLYNSFIGFKDFTVQCDESVVGDRNLPCSTELDAEGGIFRVDVPNGTYRFVAVVGDADNPHAHRFLAENGGTGDPTEISDDHVVLIGNHNQADFFNGTAEPARFGTGVFARVGFDDKMPPAPSGDPTGSVPQFIDYNENGDPVTECTSPVDPDNADEFVWNEELVQRHDGEEYSVPAVTCTSAGPNSPTLEVTEGYIRFHLLQGNSNNPVESDEGANFYFTPEDVEVNLAQDRNGGDLVLLEVWPVTAGTRGDYNGNGELDAGDLDLQSQAMKDQDLAFDENGDDVVDVADRELWVNDLKNTWMGDSNLDLEFNSGDLVQVFTAGKYDSGEMAGWEEGDWDGDMVFGSGDLVTAFTAGGYELGPKPAAAAIPEPSSLMLLLVGLLACLRRRR